MLTSISSRIPTQREETAADMLLGCHDRIRHFTAMSLRLAEATSTSNREIADAAEAVHRYFTVALPLHEADENESLHPRLRAAAPAEMARASQLMVDQHRGIDSLIAELVPLWDALRREPARLVELASTIAEKTQHLQRLWDEHLTLEEQVVFPAMQQCLSAEALAAIRDEMQRRRS